jgi:DNA-directed RNA polymerase specialized sigma24 family protein
MRIAQERELGFNNGARLMSDSVQLAPPVLQTDRECLREWRRHREVESLRPIVERYLAFVYSSAYRRTADPTLARTATEAVFLVFIRRARKLRVRTVLARWLFDITALTCRKLVGKPKRRRRWLFFRARPREELTGLPWERVTPVLDVSVSEISPAFRGAFLLRVLLNQDWEAVAGTLRVSALKARVLVANAISKITKKVGKAGSVISPEELELACKTAGCVAPANEGLGLEVWESLRAVGGKRPKLRLARRVLGTLAWIRWRRRVAIGAPLAFVCFATLGGVGWYIDSLSGHSRLLAMFLFWSARHEARTTPGLTQPARPWPTGAGSGQLTLGSVSSAKDFYRSTNIWLAHLKFSRDEWQALEPKKIGVLPNFLQRDGTVLLRNPNAQRSGLAGVLGLEFEWTRAQFELGGSTFTNVAVRLKGNGSYLGSLYGQKRPFKVDLNKFVRSQKFADVSELNFHNLVADHSYLSDTLGYEFFRDAGVPASRTAYAYLSVTADGKLQHQPLGLYVLAEPVNGAFMADRFGSKNVPLFKPVTYELFKHLGDDWSSYAAIYDLKTSATPAQRQRVIDFARLVSYGSDAELAAHLGDYVDLDEFARFMAAQVLLSNYDSILADGQNFYMYMDPKTEKFGFIPWDLDVSWGGFFLLGSMKERERASIWHPWVEPNRFLARVFEVEEFRRIYKGYLEDFLGRLFVTRRLYARIDEMAGVIRDPIAAESDFRLRKFEQAVSDKVLEQREKSPADRLHQLKRFIKNRSTSVRRQLDGVSQGFVLERRGRN